MSFVPVGDLDLVLAQDDMPGGGFKSIATVSAAADDDRETAKSNPRQRACDPRDAAAEDVSWTKYLDNNSLARPSYLI